MDFDYFDKILRKHRLDQEPAFEKVLVEIAPLPPMKGNPLGLYYPDPDKALNVASGTIWVPPDADEETVLHELGHRYYDYYARDLSEAKAESYRLAHPPRLVVRRAPARLEEDHTVRNVLIAIGVVAVSIIALNKIKSKNR